MASRTFSVHTQLQTMTKEEQHNRNWWKHWSMSGSVLIAAICLGRDVWRDMGEFHNSSVYWYMLESLVLVLVVVLVAVRTKDSSFENIQSSFDNLEDVFENGDAEINNYMSNKETQTEHKDYKKSIERLKSCHHVRITRVNKDIRQLRKYCADKIKKLKADVKEVTKVMSAIQLKVPSLVKESRFLTEEKDAIDIQIAEEMAKQTEIQERFLSLHSYMHGYGRATLTETLPDLL